MSNKHLIGKLTIQIEVSSSGNAYSIQQQWSEMTWKSLVPELDKLFNSISGENEVIRFNYIELDIGDIILKKGEENNIVDEIVARLRKFIKERLTDQHDKPGAKGLHPGDMPSADPSFKNTNTASPAGEGHYGKNSEGPENRGADKRLPEPLKHQSLSARYFELWLYWLEKGTLPAYTPRPEESWMELVLENLVMDNRAVTQLQQKLKKHPLAMQRLVLQHSPKDLRSIAELYTGYSQKGLSGLSDEIRSVLTRSGSRPKVTYRQLETAMWACILQQVILEGEKADSISLGQRLIQLPLMDVVRDELKKISETNAVKYPFLQEICKKSALKGEEDRHPEGGAMPLQKNDGLRNSNDLSDTSENSLIPKTEPLPREVMESPQFFKNAGLVLLHPFLGRFFKKLGLIEGNAFTDFECRSKAVLLLHFLATGKEHFPEYEMVLPKFLCEMPSNLPLDHTLSLSGQEKEEAYELLRAAIDHWGALGTTSPDGLRGGFLIREGKLEKEQTGWKLYVEQKTQDILLDRLPWNLSIIKLAWMKEILRVEWR